MLQNLQTYAKFTLHDFRPIFHPLTGFDKSRQMLEIGGKLVHESDNRSYRALWIIKDAIWGNHRCVPTPVKYLSC